MTIQNLTGQILGQYELSDLLGAGGMGAVYRAYQRNLKRHVAVKILSAQLAEQPDYIARFVREAETSAALEHPHIVPVHDYGVQQNLVYVVMRLLTGGSLSERVAQRRDSAQPLPSLGEVADLLKQLAGALDYAHRQGVIHRDIKPGNIMFDSDGNAYLVDFGIAKLLQETTSLTASGSVVGTWGYMAPEQWRAETLGPATDQYALGVMIYALVTGRLPFEAPTPAGVMHKHLNEMPTPPQTLRPGIPASVTAVLNRAMAKSVADRYPSVTAFAQAFDSATRGQTGEVTNYFTTPLKRRPASGTATPISAPGHPITATRPVYRHPAMWALGAALLVAVIVIAFLLLGGSEEAKPPATTAPGVAVISTEAEIPTGQPTNPFIQIIQTDTLSPVPTETPTPTFTLTSTPTLPDTEKEATIQAEIEAMLTITATHWTPTSTPSYTPTEEFVVTDQVRLGQTQTQQANEWIMTQTQMVFDLTATADTARPTNPPRPTATVTPITPTVTLNPGVIFPTPTLTPITAPTLSPQEQMLAWADQEGVLLTSQAYLYELDDVKPPTIVREVFIAAGTQVQLLSEVERPHPVSGEILREVAVIEDREQTARGWMLETLLEQAMPLTPRVTAKDLNDVNIRFGDSLAFSVVDSLRAGEYAIILGISNRNRDWYKIRLPNEEEGWVSSGVVIAIGDLSNLSLLVPPPLPVRLTMPPAVTATIAPVFTPSGGGEPSSGGGDESPAGGGQQPIQITVNPGGGGGTDNQPTPVAAVPEEAFFPVGSSNRDWTPVIQDFDGVEMVLVPAGCFMMGSTEDEIATIVMQTISDWYWNEGPQHEVCFEEPFWIDRTEVTNGQFAAFDGQAASSSRFSGDERPREQISWIDAQAFCESRGARLPTEAEWEYAARGPESWVYPWGNEFVSDNVVWDENSGGQTADVGSRLGDTSWVGALDMSGNVGELVADWYYAEYYGTLADGVVNPTGPPAFDYRRVVRGGSWGDDLKYGLRAAGRGMWQPDNWRDFLGFRCARSADLATPPNTSAEPTPVAAAPKAAFFPAGSSNRAWTPVIRDFDGVEMVLVPAGCFMMGSDIGNGEGDERPVHRVCLSEFWIGQTEVTNAQYKRCVDAGACTQPGTRTYYDDPAYADHPVIYVDWQQASDYAIWAGGSLPTEAQWEYAARGPEAWTYPWGTSAPTCEQANISGCAGGTAPVGPDRRAAGASWVGALDMSGNVGELVADWYNEDYYATLPDGALNPGGPASSEAVWRVWRGGLWYFYQNYARSAFRGYDFPNYWSNFFGFRWVHSAGLPMSPTG